MTATFVNSSVNATGTAGTSGTVTAPTGIAVGDFLLLSVGYGSGASVTTLSGWTSLGTSTGTNIKHSMFWKFAVAGDLGATWTWSFTGTTTTWVFGVVAYRGTDPTTPIDAHVVSANTTTSQNVTTPTVTSVSSDNILVYVRGVKDDTGTASNAECTPTTNRRALDALTISTTVAHGVTMWDNGPASVGSGSHTGLATTCGTTTPNEGFAHTFSIANGASTPVNVPVSKQLNQAVNRAASY